MKPGKLNTVSAEEDTGSGRFGFGKERSRLASLPPQPCLSMVEVVLEFGFGEEAVVEEEERESEDVNRGAILFAFVMAMGGSCRPSFARRVFFWRRRGT